MSKNKLSKFSDMAQYANVFEYPFSKLEKEGFAMRGHWSQDFFKNANPIVLELGCGKGEYTVGLAELHQKKNFIGIDIKGARMWAGATQALNKGLNNVAFLRTHIELIDRFFAPNEVSEIWITFPDPQMNKTNKRLTSTRFMTLYSSILEQTGIIHLKTDSSFLYTYTNEVIKTNQLPIISNTDDLYSSGSNLEILSIKTFYEQQWLSRGIKIKYIQFKCLPHISWIEPDVTIEKDSYRSFGRNNVLNNISKKE